VLVALGLVASLPTFRPPAAPVFREGRVVEIRSLVPEHRPVPRSDLVLRWTSDPDGAAFTVRVSTSDFRTVFVAEGLDRTECRVPEEALAGIAAGARLLWQVEAVAPDGRRSASPTFFVVLE